MLSASFYLPRFVQRLKTITVDLTLSEDGAVVAIDSATYSLYDENSVAIVDAETAVVAPLTNVLTYEVTSAILPLETILSDNWLEEWVVTFTDGRVETVRREVSLCLRLLYPLVNDSDLLERHSDLTKLLADGEDDWHKPINAAWKGLNAKLLGTGKRPYLILSSWALRELHICMTLEIIFTDLQTYSGGGPGKYTDLSSKYNKCTEKLWGGLQLTMDSGETGKPADAVEDATSPVVYLKGI